MSQPIEHRLTTDEQLCFIHIPKTAGTTLTSLLNSKFHQSKICPAEVWSEIIDIPREELAQYQLFRGHFFYDIGELLPRKPVYITVLRHPIERVISGYEFMRRNIPTRTEALTNHYKAKTMTLMEYVSDLDNPSMANSQTRHLSLSRYKDEPEAWLAVAKQHLAEFACFGLVERFQDSMALLSYTFGWNPLAEYSNLMIGSRQLKQEQLEPEVLETIASRNALDLALYEYAQELFADHYAQMVQILQKRYGSTPSSLEDITVRIPDLLEQHYRDRYAEQPRAAAQIPQGSLTANLDFDFNQALSGSGWHLREGSDPAFRWTGPGTTSTIDLPLAIDQDLTLEFCVINTLAADILQSLTLQVNDRPIPLGVLYSHGITLFQAIIPRAALISTAPFTRLTFQVSHTISPQDLNPHDPDRRPVGLAFSAIQTFPTAETGKTAAALFESQPWQETAKFVQQHLQPQQQILAPTVFRARFPQYIPTYTSPLPTLRNYNPSLKEFCWAILHKGMMSENGALLGKLAWMGLVPLYANEVFVVFGKDRKGKPAAIAYTSPHVKSLYIGSLKYFWQNPDRPWNQLQTSFKRIAKKNIKARTL